MNIRPKTEIPLTCAECGIAFVANTWDHKRGRKYCSKSCGATARNKTRVGALAAHWKGGLATYTCTQCGGTYQKPPSIGNRYEHPFCNRTCYAAWLQTQSGPLANQWQGGISFEPYPITFNRPFKRQIRERDRYTCAVCGAPGSSVHHINYVKDDTTPANCVTLCRSCHAKTNHHRW